MARPFDRFQVSRPAGQIVNFWQNDLKGSAKPRDECRSSDYSGGQLIAVSESSVSI
jgi:hypothetical protein